jgi:hypothetical protein
MNIYNLLNLKIKFLSIFQFFHKFLYLLKLDFNLSVNYPNNN